MLFRGYHFGKVLRKTFWGKTTLEAFKSVTLPRH